MAKSEVWVLIAGEAGICCWSRGSAAAGSGQPLAGAADTGGVSRHDGGQRHASQPLAGMSAA